MGLVDTDSEHIFEWNTPSAQRAHFVTSVEFYHYVPSYAKEK